MGAPGFGNDETDTQGRAGGPQTPGDLAYACWAYETMTGYAKSWQDFRDVVGDGADLRNAKHRDALFAWLNQWGCRIAVKSEVRVKSCLSEWYTRNGDRLGFLAGGERDLAGVSQDELRAVAGLFDSLLDDMRRAATRKSLRFGPTAVSKTLFALRPRLFPAWDSAIRQAVVDGEDTGEAYVSYASRLQNDIRKITSLAAELDIACLPEVLRPGRNATMVQLMGEYYWVTVTREVKLPPLHCRLDWAAWSTIESESILSD